MEPGAGFNSLGVIRDKPEQERLFPGECSTPFVLHPSLRERARPTRTKCSSCGGLRKLVRRVSDTLRSRPLTASFQSPVHIGPDNRERPRPEMALSLGLFVSLTVFSVSVTGSSAGNPLDNEKWMSTVSQYDKSKYWNKFRDVSFSTTFTFTDGSTCPVYEEKPL
ncbi:hypothetical protein IRJ41_017456 [Triplophysa rosa]|uniref:Uncharacterized protein n=1 Tax=Triplophysa rosa TaxID=992332 RepID=A0A9W7TQE4_TRIRA|nr:hypothetical protein IRJ41_017456 [Triplophysa rosa]